MMKPAMMAARRGPMQKAKAVGPKPMEAKKFQGKGTRARLNTAASKSFFGSKASK